MFSYFSMPKLFFLANGAWPNTPQIRRCCTHCSRLLVLQNSRRTLSYAIIYNNVDGLVINHRIIPIIFVDTKWNVVYLYDYIASAFLQHGLNRIPDTECVAG